jgi:hypothetical protein
MIGGEITDAALEAAPPQQPEIGARKEAGAD